MVKYGKGFIMTKKMTITLEDSLIKELDSSAKLLGKKKTQIIREALHSYLDLNTREQKITQWEQANKAAIEEYNKSVEEEGLVLQHRRIF